MPRAGLRCGCWFGFIAACCVVFVAPTTTCFHAASVCRHFRNWKSSPSDLRKWPGFGRSAEKLASLEADVGNDPIPVKGSHNNLRRTVTVVGGGVAGMAAACALAEAGFQVQLIERRNYLGGRASSYLH